MKVVIRKEFDVDDIELFNTYMAEIDHNISKSDLRDFLDNPAEFIANSLNERDSRGIYNFLNYNDFDELMENEFGNDEKNVGSVHFENDYDTDDEDYTPFDYEDDCNGDCDYCDCCEYSYNCNHARFEDVEEPDFGDNYKDYGCGTYCSGECEKCSGNNPERQLYNYLTEN